MFINHLPYAGKGHLCYHKATGFGLYKNEIIPAPEDTNI